MRKLVAVLLLVGLIASAVVAQDDEMAHVRIVHLSSDAGAVDIYVDGEILESEVEFADAIGWLELDAGEYAVAVVPTEGDIEDAILEADLELESGDWITVAAIGLVDRDSIALQVLSEDYSPIGQFGSRLSVFHAVSSYDPVNVYVNDQELIRFLGYPGFWGPDSDGFITFDLLAQKTDIRLEQDDGTVAADLEDIPFGSQRHYFLAIAGTPANPQYILLSSDLDALVEEDS